MYQTIKISASPNDIAPDKSEIYYLTTLKKGGMCLCQLPAGQTSIAVCHKTVEEMWFFLSGEGEVWRKYEGNEEITPVSKGMAITIPLGCHFQFRNIGTSPLQFVITTLPPWPGNDEAFLVNGKWL